MKTPGRSKSKGPIISAECSNTVAEDVTKERANINAEIADAKRILANAQARLAKVGKPLSRKDF